ncbi:conjugal transfer protein TrbF [uncultured Thiodictyon sp.]|uniref:conjugal transfer protein TrbF n=1 Tax=uncultured Thiodictyon sp. TaxID=1846217 RepID=UPI0025FD327A|nr:conjugal transfer protein TrbF [uncultured Thiodictyon sp.]
MRFKRPQVRYSDTPEPITPYQAAAQVWDQRIGSARVQARNWRLIAFGCLTLAMLMAGGLVWRSAQSIVTPYVVEVATGGQVRAVGEAATPYKPNDAQIAYHLARFLTDVRSLSIDPIVVRQNWLEAYAYTTDKGGATLNDFARSNDPFARIGQMSTAVEVTSVVRASESSFQVRWTERNYANGSPAGIERWTAVLSVELQPPRTEERLRKNPLGIYINGLSWSRELDVTEGAKTP